VDFKGSDEDDKPKVIPGGRAILWTTPIKKVDLHKYFPVFVEGLREKVEPLMFLAEKGLDEMIESCNVKTLLENLRGIIYPIKDNIRSLDNEICVKTLMVMYKLAKRSDKIAEAFIPHFPIILPSVDILRTKFSVDAPKRARSAAPKRFVKLEEMRPKQPDIGPLIQEILEYFERHGGLYAFVTIKKMIPRYESALFC
jgi:hypothetical protein